MLIGLCLTEIVSWGVLYYAFPVLAPGIAADTGWSIPATTASFAAALVVSALVGIPVGRLLDRRGPRLPMTVGSVVAAGGLVAVASGSSLPTFTLGWLLTGAGMAGVLYPPAFAAITRWYGARSLPALTALTLVAGLASTVFAPLTAALDSRLDWRTVYVVLALLLLVVTLPVHVAVLRRPWPPDHHGEGADREGERRYVATVVRSPDFWALTAGLTLASLAMYAFLVNLVPLLLERGLTPTTAAWALGAGGLGQVAGRSGYSLVAPRLTVRGSTIVIFGLAAVSAAAIGAVPGPAGLLISLAVLAGVARGIATLLHATAVPDRWGPRSYGRLSGILGAPVILASALAPWVGSAVADLLDSYARMYLALAAVGGLGAVLLGLSAPRRRGTSRRARLSVNSG